MFKSILPAMFFTISSACAASPALVPVGESDVAGGPDFEDVRQTDPDLMLATTGDYDGDGQIDEARLFKDEGLGAFALIVTWGDSAKPRITVHADTLRNVPRVAVTTLPPGPLRYICYGLAEGCDENRRKMIETSTDTIGVVYMGGGRQVAYVWNGEDFDARTVVD